MWAITGSLERATRTAFRISRVVAFGMIAVGVMLAFEFGDQIGGIWLALIGVFVLQAAAAELRVSTSAATADARRVGDVMHPFAATVTPETPISDLSTAIAHAPPGTAYPVIADDQVVGLFVCDVVHTLPPDRQALARVSDLMIARRDLTFVDPTTPLTAARTAVARDHWGRALVVDGGILVGIVGLSDLTGRPLAI